MTATTLTQTITIPTYKIGNAGKEAAALLREAARYEKLAKEAKARAKSLLSEVLPLEAGNEGTFGGIAIVKVAQGTTKGTDYKTLEEAFPEAYAATVTFTPYQYYKTV